MNMNDGTKLKYIIAAALGHLAFPCHSARPPTLVNLTQPNLTSPLCLPLETMPTSNSPLSLSLSLCTCCFVFKFFA